MAQEMRATDLKPEPKITAEQLNKRGACLPEILMFKRMFGNETVVTVALASSVAHLFDFGWAIHELLFEDDCKAVFDAIIKRCVPPPDKENWVDGSTSLLTATAQEFARKYVEVYPHVP